MIRRSHVFPGSLGGESDSVVLDGSDFLGFIPQNTAFIKTTIRQTAAIATQKPISIPQKEVVPKKSIQIAVQFIESTSIF